MSHQDPQDFSSLSPDAVLSALETLGFETTGRLLALNSYENRVYRVELENTDPLVAKFYRPGRWSNDAIQEEHEFSQELAEQEIPLVVPLAFDGTCLMKHQGYRFSLYENRGGRWPDLEGADDLLWMGRFIARIHAIGDRKSFVHRPVLDVKTFGADSVSYLSGSGLIPAHIEVAYQTLAEDIIARVEQCYHQAGAVDKLRLHGDFHRGNILWTDDGPHFVDMDDCRSGPAIQDLWMLLSGERQEMSTQMSEIIEGYENFRSFNWRELHLIEALRTLRIMHYAAWLARRRLDPAFEQAFPWFYSDQFWEQHILELREQLSRMDEPVLAI